MTDLTTSWRTFAQDDSLAHFEPFYLATRPLVWSICRRLLGNHEDAHDAFQSTYARLLAVARAGDEPAPAPEVLIYRLAIREAENLRKRRARRGRRELPMPEHHDPTDRAALPDLEAERLEERERLATLVALLPEAERVPILLHFYHGKTQLEIADILGHARQTVARRIERGLRRLEPLARRAGLSDALGATVAAGGATALLTVPSGAAYATGFVHAEALAGAAGLSGGASVLAGASGGGLLSAAGAKLVAAAATCLLVAGGIALHATMDRPQPPPPAPRVAAALPQDAHADTFARMAVPDMVAEAAKAQPEPDLPNEAADDGNHAMAAVEVTAAASPAPTPAPTPEPRATIFGRVWDEAKGEPAPGAEVIVFTGARERRAIAGRHGEFRIEDAPIGRVALFARQGNLRTFGPNNGMQRLTLAADGESGPHNLQLRPAATLAGRIVQRGSGEPIVGARISLNPMAMYRHEEPILTDANGNYRIEALMPGRSMVIAQADVHVTDAVHVTLEAGLETRSDFNLEPGALIDVVVRDAAGLPVSGAGISIRFSDSYTPPPTFYTDDQGRVRVDTISRSRPSPIVVQKADYKRVDAMPDFSPGEEIGRAEVVLQPVAPSVPGKSIAGRVTAEGGAPIEGIAVEWRQDRHGRGMTAHTDREGRYRIKPRGEGGVVAAYSPDPALPFAPVVKAVPTPQSENDHEPVVLDFSMPPGAQLTGRLVDDQGRPHVGATIRINESAQDWQGIPGVKEVRIDEDGCFAFDRLPAGKISIRATSQNQEELITYRTIQTGVDVELVVAGPGELLGRVVDAATSAPVTRFTIKPMFNGIEAMRYDSGEHFVDSAGHFRLTDLVVDTPLHLTFEAEGYAPLVLRDLAADPVGRGVRHLFALGKGAELRGRLVDARTGGPIVGAVVWHGIAANENPYINWDSFPRNTNMQDLRQAISASDGTFSFIDNADRTMIIRHPTYARTVIVPAQRPVQTDGDGLMLVALAPGATIEIAPGNGFPLDPEAFRLSWENAGGEPPQVNTEGHLIWEDLAMGHYTVGPYIQVKNRSFSGLSQRVQLEMGEHKKIRFGDGLGSVAIEGRVMVEGRPWPAIVRISPEFDWDYTALATNTDADGYYRLEGLRPGPYTASISSTSSSESRYYTFGVDVAGPMRQDFSIGPRHALEVVLQFEPEFPRELRDAVVQVLLQRTEKSDSNFILPQVNAPLDGGVGRVSHYIQGNYQATLMVQRAPNGFLHYRLAEPLALDNLEGDQRVTLRVAAPAALALTLGLAPDVPPAPMMVRLDPAAGGAPLMVSWGDKAAPEQLLEGLPPGRWRVVPMVAGYRAEPESLEVELAPNATAAVAFQLAPVGIIIGEVYAADGRTRVKPRSVGISGPSGRRLLVQTPDPGWPPRDVEDALHDDEFRFNNLAPGPHRLIVEADGYRPLVLPIEITPGPPQEPLQIQLEPVR